MKTKWVATLNAGKFKALLLVSWLFLIISCDKSDDIETIGNESPIDNESPPDNESPTDHESVIIYIDIEPDFTSENLNDSYNLDLNNDKIIDFTVNSDFDSWEKWLVIASNPNAENGILSVAPWYSHPVPLNSGNEIFNLRGYRNGEYYETWGIFAIGNCFGGEQGCSYDWKDKSDMYLGLRFIVNGQRHYGWARLDVISFTQWVIKDYAYNATPNKLILAGQRN